MYDSNFEINLELVIIFVFKYESEKIVNVNEYSNFVVKNILINHTLYFISYEIYILNGIGLHVITFNVFICILHILYTAGMKMPFCKFGCSHR